MRDLTSIPAVQLIDDLAKMLDQVIGRLAPAGTCALIDYPDYSNVGDSAIWLGERAYLRRAGFKMNYVCSRATYSERRLRDGVGKGLILISGGGNFGDLWPQHQELREAVIRAFPRNKIVQLPQSLWFQQASNLARTRAVFDAHPDVTILVRDRRGLELARNEFRAASLLCPDMAFALGPLRRPHAPDQDVVHLLRRDIESTKRSSPDPAESSVDWLADRDSVSLRLHRFVSERRFRHPRVANWCAPLLTLLDRATRDRLARQRLDRGCSMLSRGRVVVTDRLHGHILSLLLGIPHVLLDNSYGKLSSFYETWTRSSDLAHWAETPAEASALATRLVHTTSASVPRDRSCIGGGASVPTE